MTAETQLGKQSILEFRTLHVGGYLHAGEEIPHFVGQLQQIWFNGYPYLEIARSSGNHQASHQGVTPIIRVTGKFGKRNHPVHYPVTFTSKHTFVGLPVLKAYVETNVYFQVTFFQRFSIIIRECVNFIWFSLFHKNARSACLLINLTGNSVPVE